jgi:DNA primase
MKLWYMTLEEAKRVDITDWLARQGYQPAYRKGENWWYISMLPDRTEHTPSLKVNTRLNRWIDFGNGEKGSLIDLGMLYHRCSIAEFLARLHREPAVSQQEHRQITPDPATLHQGITVTLVQDLLALPLLCYLQRRKIPLKIARQYCKEVYYQVRLREYYAIGFPNRSGGFELRNERMKTSTSPKDSSWLRNNALDLAVFEGFFDFLSYQTLASREPERAQDYYILNSTAFFNKSLPTMLAYDHVHLYLDRDETGQKFTRQALQLDPRKFLDRSPLYTQYKDLNEMLTYTAHRPRQRPSLGP